MNKAYASKEWRFWTFGLSFGICELLLLRRIQERKKIKIFSNSWIPGYQGNLPSVHLHFIFLLTEWKNCAGLSQLKAPK